jgi:hypothetical protein
VFGDDDDGYYFQVNSAWDCYTDKAEVKIDGMKKFKDQPLTFTYETSNHNDDLNHNINLYRGIVNRITVIDEIVETPIQPPSTEDLIIFIDDWHLFCLSEDEKWLGDQTENPCEYLIRTIRYDLKPNPEVSTTLFTPYNIRSDGIIIGANIKTWAYTLDSTANQVNTVERDLKRFTEEVDDKFEGLEERLKKLEDKINVFQLIEGALELTKDLAMKFGGEEFEGILEMAKDGFTQISEGVNVIQNIVDKVDKVAKNILGGGGFGGLLEVLTDTGASLLNVMGKVGEGIAPYVEILGDFKFDDKALTGFLPATTDWAGFANVADKWVTPDAIYAALSGKFSAMEAQIAQLQLQLNG